MKYVIGATAVLAAIGTAAYFYLQDKDGQAAEAQAENQQATDDMASDEPAANI